MKRVTLALGLVAILAVTGCAVKADRLGLVDVKGHPVRRFPLTISIGRFDDDVERAVFLAAEDWNVVFRETFKTSIPAFVVGQYSRGIHVVISPVTIFLAPATAHVRIERPAISGAVEALVNVDRSGVIQPVRIFLRQTAGSGETNRETFFRREISQALGRALGLPDGSDPRSAGPRLAAQYFTFWSSEPER